jgi:site-specific recombinase XerD
MSTLRARMEADLRIQNYRPSTQREYVRSVYHLARHFMKSPAEMGEEEVRAYLLHLVDDRRLSPSTLKVTTAALKFLYEVTLGRPEVVRSVRMPRTSVKLPVILGGSEVVRLFEAIESPKYRVIVMTAYGAGLRVGETCSLEISDIDSKRMVIRIRNGKGGRDRYAMLADRLLEALRTYYRLDRPPGPHLFPGQRPGTAVRPDSVRRVLEQAVAKAGIKKPVTPHILRHTFATHVLEAGGDIRTIQMLLGHRSIQTTQLYAQVSTDTIRRAKSPLDLLGTKEGEVLG